MSSASFLNWNCQVIHLDGSRSGSSWYSLCASLTRTPALKHTWSGLKPLRLISQSTACHECQVTDGCTVQIYLPPTTLQKSDPFLHYFCQSEKDCQSLNLASAAINKASATRLISHKLVPCEFTRPHIQTASAFSNLARGKGAFTHST